MTSPLAPTIGADLAPEIRDALAGLLLALADDEFVLGFADSEWTGIAPILEEDVALSSIAQDELGHAAALYALLGRLTDRDPDAIAYDRSPADYRHARLLDHPRGDWAATIARRWLYDTADGIRIESLAGSSWQPLAELAALIAREERYHRLHVGTWLERLAAAGGEARARLLVAWEDLRPDAATVLAPLPGEASLVEAGILPMPSAELDRRWREAIAPLLARVRLPVPPRPRAAELVRSDHSDAFRRLHAEFTAVRRIDPAATW